MPISFADAIKRQKLGVSPFVSKPFVGVIGKNIADQKARQKAAEQKRSAEAGRVPAGYYDPALDAALRASGRGVADLRIDTDTANQRASTGFLTAKTRIGEDERTSLAGLLRARTRGGEDYTRNTQGLDRSYQHLGQSQTGRAVEQGLLGGGTFAAALAARRENQGLAQKELDTDRDRLFEDIRSQEEAVQRAAARGLEDAGGGYQYGVDDRALGLQRAEREHTLFGTDTQAQREFQGAAAGWVRPKPKPKPKPKSKKKGK